VTSQCLLAAQVVNNTVITEIEICNSDHSSNFNQCISRRGGTFNFDVSTSSYSNASLESLASDPEWNSLNPPFGAAGNGTLGLASTSLQHFLIAIALQGQNLNANQLGLANNSVLLHSLVFAGKLLSLSFGLFAGSQSVSKPRDGHIVFGGYDNALVNGQFSNYSMSNTTLVGSRVCSLEVIVTKLTLRRPGVTTDVQLLSDGNLMPSCIEP
jgi:hypothetical protein